MRHSNIQHHSILSFDHEILFNIYGRKLLWKKYGKWGCSKELKHKGSKATDLGSSWSSKCSQTINIKITEIFSHFKNT